MKQSFYGNGAPLSSRGHSSNDRPMSFSWPREAEQGSVAGLCAHLTLMSSVLWVHTAHWCCLACCGHPVFLGHSGVCDICSSTWPAVHSSQRGGHRLCTVYTASSRFRKGEINLRLPRVAGSIVGAATAVPGQPGGGHLAQPSHTLSTFLKPSLDPK